MKGTIVEGATKALFGSAWANYQEEHPRGVNLSQKEILNEMPNPPEEALDKAADLIQAVEKLNGEDITESFKRAKALPDKCATRPCSPFTFGFYLTMQAMGEGVGLETICDNDAFKLKTPWIEFSWMDLDPETYPSIPNH